MDMEQYWQASERWKHYERTVAGKYTVAERLVRKYYDGGTLQERFDARYLSALHLVLIHVHSAYHFGEYPKSTLKRLRKELRLHLEYCAVYQPEFAKMMEWALRYAIVECKRFL